MILLCPYCGYNLPKPLNSGIASCVNCQRVFDSCNNNQLLSAAWYIRKHDVLDAEYLSYRCGLDVNDAEFVLVHVYDECMNHEEFRDFLLKKKAS